MEGAPVSRGLPARRLAGLVAGFLVGMALMPPVAAVDCSARPRAPECPRTGELAVVLPPIPRSLRQYGSEDAVVPVATSLVDQVLDQVGSPNHQRLMGSEVRVHLIPRSQDITDLPPWQPLRGAQVPDSDTGDGYAEARTYDEVRAVGPASCRPGPLDVAIGEEQIALFTDGEHRSPGAELLGRNLVHEVGHAVECSLTPAQEEALAASYAVARQRPLDQVVGDYPAYSVSNQREYFAEGTAAWFGVRHTGSYRQAWLAEHDPGLHAVMASVYDGPASVAGHQRAALD
jgi:hypothetical protein